MLGVMIYRQTRLCPKGMKLGGKHSKYIMYIFLYRFFFLFMYYIYFYLFIIFYILLVYSTSPTVTEERGKGVHFRYGISWWAKRVIQVDL